MSILLKLLHKTVITKFIFKFKRVLTLFFGTKFCGNQRNLSIKKISFWPKSHFPESFLLSSRRKFFPRLLCQKKNLVFSVMQKTFEIFVLQRQNQIFSQISRWPKKLAETIWRNLFCTIVDWYVRFLSLGHKSKKCQREEFAKI